MLYLLLDQGDASTARDLKPYLKSDDALEDTFAVLDLNDDGSISLDEIAAAEITGEKVIPDGSRRADDGHDDLAGAGLVVAFEVEDLLPGAEHGAAVGDRQGESGHRETCQP